MDTMISYAQNGEDVILRRIFCDKKVGFYIDIGASHPETFSVTKHFYDQGWHGINVEPLKKKFELFKKDRPLDLNLNVAIDIKKGTRVFFEVTDYPELSTLSAEGAVVLSRAGHKVISHRVKTIAGDDLFSKHAHDPVDFMKVDVEGGEYEVISSINFLRYRPKVLLIEATIPNSNFPGWDNLEFIFNFKKWEPILLRSGYIFAYFDGLNRFYVSEENKKFLTYFQVGICVWDNFSKYQQVNRIVELDWSEVKKSAECLAASSRDKMLKTIAVDLTLILPGGESGGAKIFVLELLHRLAEMNPRTQFVLLTQNTSHEELAVLDRPNMRRQMVVASMAPNSFRSRLMGLATHIFFYLPVRLRSVVSCLGHKFNASAKRSGSGSLLRDMGADLLFCPFTAPTYFEPGIPMVCTIYDLQYKTYPEFFGSHELVHRERAFFEACRLATILIAISDFSRDSAIVHGGLDLSRIRTIHLRLAYRIQSQISRDAGILNRLGLTPKRYLIFPANFWKHKNHKMLLTAFGMACHEGLASDIKLVCTGAPVPRRDWLIEASRSLNLSDRVIFPGYLQNKELSVLVESSRGMIFPSLYEGFGLPVIEAMAAGIPVACSNTTSFPEVAGEAAIFFDPRVPTQIAQAIISLVEDEVLRARLIQAGLRRAVEFSDGERMTEEYWKLFQSAVATVKHENKIDGVYPDGWVGPRLNISVVPATGKQTIEIEFFVPGWSPQPLLIVQAMRSGRPHGSPFIIARGTSVIWSMSVEPSGGYYEIRVAPTFVPEHSGYGNDQRKLSAMLKRCSIVCADGKYIQLFPVKVTA